MSFDWCRIWWEFYGEGRQLAIFMVTADNMLAGLLPMYIDNFGLWPFKIRIARLVGATDGPTRILDPPIRPDIASTVIKTVVDTLLQEKSCDLVSIGPVKSPYPGISGMISEYDGKPYRARLKQTGIIAFYDLSRQPEDYLTTLGPSEQKHRRYDFRYLARHGAEEAMVVGPEMEIEMEFRRFARMHTDDWNVKGRLGHFNAWPRAFDYQLTLTKCLYRLNRLRLHRIRTGQDIISYDYGFVFGRSYFWELRARSLDDRWAKISLGSCALIWLLRHAVREQVTCLYAGVGSQEYKTRLGAEERPVVTVSFTPKSRLSGVRVAAFNLVHKLLEILYFKIWYMRIQPRLSRFFRRPIWKFWSRIST